MKIGYIIWLEKIEKIYIQSQVIDVLSHMNNVEKRLISFVYSSDYSKEDIRKIKKELLEKNIPSTFIRLFIPKRLSWFYYSRELKPAIFLISLFYLYFLTVFNKFNVLHFRSYPIVQTGIFLKNIFKNIKVVFDPRSPFPEECCTLRHWSLNSKQYSSLKKAEFNLINNSDLTISISESFIDHLKQDHNNIGRIEVVPNNVDITLFDPSRYDSIKVRRELNIDKNAIVFGYVGSFVLNAWNCPKIYLSFMEKMIKKKRNTHFLFITPHIDLFKKQAVIANIPESYYSLVTAEHEKVPYYLSVCNFGMNIMAKEDSRLSIKTVEYMSMGLPLVSNKNLTGVVELINAKNLGIVYDNDFSDIDKIDNFQNSVEIQKNCRSYAIENYSSTCIAKKYIKLYESI